MDTDRTALETDLFLILAIRRNRSENSDSSVESTLKYKMQVYRVKHLY